MLAIAQALASPAIDHNDARLLLADVLGVEHAYLIAHSERTLSAQEHNQFIDLVTRRSAGEPVAYLLGWREFYGRRFRVGPAVLIPRPETELLVEQALTRIGAAGAARVLDLGTGSGVIALTLALERLDLEVTATEIAAEALALAQANARVLCADHVRLLHGDWFAPVAGAQFDLIVSNPPYIAEADPHLARGDVRFEPRRALIAGSDGLQYIRAIVAEARGHLSPGGWLIFEHGYDQAGACANLLTAAGYREVFLANDLAGLPRVSGGRRPAK